MNKIFDVPEEDEAKIVARIESYIDRAFQSKTAKAGETKARPSFGGEERTLITEQAGAQAFAPPADPRQKAPSSSALRRLNERSSALLTTSNVVFFFVLVAALILIWVFLARN